MILSKDKDKQKAAAEFVKYLESAESLTKWDTGTGYLPPRKGMDKEGDYKKLMDERSLEGTAPTKNPCVPSSTAANRLRKPFMKPLSRLTAY